MRVWRWRAFGVAFSIAGLGALLGAVAETLLALWIRPGALHLGELFYAINLHLLMALLVTGLLRLVCWKCRERDFPPLALGGLLGIELGVVLNYWLLKAPFTPESYTSAGRSLGLIILIFGALVALLIARLVRRRVPGMRWVRWARGLRGALGITVALLLLVLNLVLAIASWPRNPKVEPRADAAVRERPDVIVILVDTLRRDHLSFFGYGRPTSPRLDRFFAEAYVCDAAVTPSTWTTPSVASLFTGLYPSAHGVTTALQQIPEDAPTLAEHFRSYGYRTAAFVANEIVTGSNGFAQGFEHFFPASPPWWVLHQRTALERLAMRLRHPASAKRGWRINREALEWVRATEGQPRFLYLHYMEPHSPYEPRSTDLLAVAPHAPPGPRTPPRFADFAPPQAGGDCRDWECLTDPPRIAARELAGMIARYDGEVHQVDERVGAILADLDSMGVLARAHVLLCADHGEEFGDHGGWFHGHSIYEEMIGCPLAYRPPGGLPGGRRIPRPIGVLDVAYTLCTRAGLEPPPLHQGREVPELLEQPAPANPEPVLSELPPSLYALRLGRWKLIRRGPVGVPDWRLYDLTTDPGERRNLAAVHPDTLAHLRGYLEGMVAEVSRSSLRRIAVATDPALLERLRSLGYIN